MEALASFFWWYHDYKKWYRPRCAVAQCHMNRVAFVNITSGILTRWQSQLVLMPWPILRHCRSLLHRCNLLPPQQQLE